MLHWVGVTTYRQLVALLCVCMCICVCVMCVCVCMPKVVLESMTCYEIMGKHFDVIVSP